MPRLSGRAIIAALPAILEERKARDIWREYVAETLRIISENTAKSAEGGGLYMTAKYADIISPRPVETRTGAEIIDHMKAKLAKIGGE